MGMITLHFLFISTKKPSGYSDGKECMASSYCINDTMDSIGSWMTFKHELVPPVKECGWKAARRGSRLRMVI